MLRIASAALEVAVRHAGSGYPLEVCGFLAGTEQDGLRTAFEAWPVPNAWESDPEDRARVLAGAALRDGLEARRWEAHGAERRYLISGQDHVAAMKRARLAGLEIVGFYHTHPDHPAVPSPFDREAAWPEYSYVIFSVRQGAVVETRSWRVPDFETPFAEEPVEVFAPRAGGS